MAERIVTTCDGDDCGVEKGVSNHWYAIGFELIGGQFGGHYEIAIRPFFTRQSGDQIYCGQQCVLKAVAKWMREQTEEVNAAK